MSVSHARRSGDLRTIVLLAIFTAIEIIFCFTVLGSLPIGPIVATLAHIPVIIAALMLGKKAGLYMGFVMGICSFIVWSFMPPNPAIAFAFSPLAPYGNFWSLVICIVPRALFPVICVMIFDAMRKRFKMPVCAAVAAFVSTALHSLMVLSLIYFCFSGNSAISDYIGATYVKFMVAWGGINAVMEVILAGVVAAGVIVPLKKVSAN